MKKQLSTIALLVTTLTAAAGVGASAQAAGSSSAYTNQHHPAQACHLSVEAVANWGETSAHLPQACTYGK